jgi:hypothetical protein
MASNKDHAIFAASNKVLFSLSGQTVIILFPREERYLNFPETPVD